MLQTPTQRILQTRSQLPLSPQRLERGGFCTFSALRVPRSMGFPARAKTLAKSGQRRLSGADSSTRSSQLFCLCSLRSLFKRPWPPFADDIFEILIHVTFCHVLSRLVIFDLPFQRVSFSAFQTLTCSAVPDAGRLQPKMTSPEILRPEPGWLTPISGLSSPVARFTYSHVIP